MPAQIAEEQLRLPGRNVVRHGGRYRLGCPDPDHWIFGLVHLAVLLRATDTPAVPLGIRYCSIATSGYPPRYLDICQRYESRSR